MGARGNVPLLAAGRWEWPSEKGSRMDEASPPLVNLGREGGRIVMSRQRVGRRGWPRAGFFKG